MLKHITARSSNIDTLIDTLTDSFNLIEGAEYVDLHIIQVDHFGLQMFMGMLLYTTPVASQETRRGTESQK